MRRNRRVVILCDTDDVDKIVCDRSLIVSELST
jgi:hypothetical protein